LEKISTSTLIIGQGIAGTTLAHIFTEKNADFIILDNANYKASSVKAAGLYNPIIFKWITKVWMIDSLLPFAISFYKSIEMSTQSNLLFSIKGLKFFDTEGNANTWFLKAGKATYSQYINVADKKLLKSVGFSQNNKVGIVKQCGYFDIEKYLLVSKNSFNSKYIQAALNYNCISKSNNKWLVKVNNTIIECKSIVFCEGHQAINNPYFNYLPLQPQKGQWVDFYCENLACEKYILFKAVFIIPIGENIYRAGSTYENGEINEIPTDEAKTELIEKIKEIVGNASFKIINHVAGIRPTVPDKKPLLGEHPFHKNAYIFNGLGSKGVLMAPYFANEIANLILEKKSLLKEVDIKRFATEII
jgi:glycine oxidase